MQKRFNAPLNLDTLHFVEIPEGVDLQAEPVSIIPRALAFFIDVIIRWTILALLLSFLAFLDKAGEGIFLMLLFLSEWFYPVFFEVFNKGQTPGKKALGICVVTEYLAPIKLQSSLIRNLLLVIDFLPVGYCLGLFSMTLSSRFQRLGDLAAGSLVIYKSVRPKATETKDQYSVVPIPPDALLTAEQQTVIIDFALNNRQLSTERQQELANILKQIIPPQHEDPVVYLRGVGQWLLGNR